MQGEIDYRTTLKECLSLKGLPKKELVQIAENTKITGATENLLKTVNQKGIHSCLISGGFGVFTETITKKISLSCARVLLLGVALTISK